MWNAYRLHTIGDFSLRKITVFLVAVIIPAFLWIFAVAPTAHAADATWKNDALNYQDHDYTKLPQVPAGTNIPPDATAFEYRQPGSPAIANIIYFPPGTNLDGATSAQQVSYIVNGDTYSSPGPVTTIGVNGKPPTDRSFGTTGTTGNDAGQATPCAIKGIGWIVCPMTRWLADGMDVIFKLLKGFMVVRPIALDTTNAMYRAWEMMRNIANIAFVAAFLLIIYAQITPHGLSNYEAKKMLPRLIIAAILVNVSYYICALGVDLSNSLGGTLEQAFLNMRGNLVGTNTVANNPITWQSMSTLILSGGSVATAAGIAVNMAAGSGIGVIGLSYYLIPFLVGALLAVLVALLVLAARQALITILVIIAPLAFVAYLLPNTEKWFDRWRETFMTMLMVFPIFSAVFGGAQLAGAAIIQNAQDLNTILLGMFVQVAPIVITPLLVKVSGSLLGRIAGFANNPNKGILDRTRNWAHGKADEDKKRRIAEGMENRHNQSWKKTPLRNWATRGELRRRERDHNTKAYDHATEKAADKHYKEFLFEEDYSDVSPLNLKGRNRRRHQQRLRDLHAFEFAEDLGIKRFDAQDEALRQAAQAGMGESGIYKGLEQGAHGIVQSSQDLAIQTMAAQAAKRVTNSQLSKALEGERDNPASLVTAEKLRKVAAGIEGEAGQNRALAQAIATRHSERGEALKHIESILNDKNLSAEEELILASGQSLHTIGPDGYKKDIEISDDIQEAIVKRIASGGNVSSINALSKMIDLGPNSNPYIRTAFTDALKANSTGRQPHMAMSLIDELAQGKVFGERGFDDAIIKALKTNKFDAAGIIKSDPDTLREVDRVMREHMFSAEDKAKIKANMERAFKELEENANYKGSISNRKEPLDNISEAMRTIFN